MLAGCSHGGGSTAAPPAGAAATNTGAASAAATTKAADQACTGGLTGTEPGVVRITCDGTATIHVVAGGTNRDFHGGACQSAGDVWSAAAGVIIDVTGTHGKYTGPPVDSVALNNTATAGKGTIQLVLGGKHYFDLGAAALSGIRRTDDRVEIRMWNSTDRIVHARVRGNDVTLGPARIETVTLRPA